MSDQEKNSKAGGAGGIVDILTMWCLVPAALVTGYETGALGMAKHVAKSLLDQGKEVYQINMAAFKLGSIKSIKVFHFVTSAILLALAFLFLVFLFNGTLADTTTVIAGTIVFAVLALLNVIYAAFVVPPIPEFKMRTGIVEQDAGKEYDSDGIELHPQFINVDGVEVENSIAGKRVLANPSKVQLSRVSVLATIVILSVTGYVVVAMLYMIGAYGESRIPSIIGTFVLVLTSSGIRLVMALIAWAVKRTGMFVESLAGSLRLHVSALAAGSTYENLEKGPMELFDESSLWPAFVKLITPLEVGLLIMGFFVIALPSWYTFSLIGALTALGWVVLLLLARADKDDVAKRMTETTILFIAGHARIYASISIFIGVVLQLFVKYIPSNRSKIATDASTDTVSAFYDAIFGFFGFIIHPIDTSCRFVNTTDPWIFMGVAVVTSAALYGIATVVIAIHREQVKAKDATIWHKTRIAIVLSGVPVLIVFCFACISVFAGFKADSKICMVPSPETNATQAVPSKEVAKLPTNVQPSVEPVAVNANSSTTDSTKPAEVTVTPLTEAEAKVIELQKQLAEINKVLLAQGAPVVAPQVRAPAVPASAPVLAQNTQPSPTGGSAKKAKLVNATDDFAALAAKEGW